MSNDHRVLDYHAQFDVEEDSSKISRQGVDVMLRTQCNLRIVFLTACCLSAGILLSCRQQQPTPSNVQVDANKPKAIAVMYQGTAAVEAANKIKEKIGGPVKVLDVNIAPGYLSVDAQDLKDPNKISHYEYRNGTVSEPTATERLKIEGGEVQGMDIRRNMPISNEIRWHVGVTGTEKAGFVDADGKGNIKESRVY